MTREQIKRTTKIVAIVGFLTLAITILIMIGWTVFAMEHKSGGLDVTISSAVWEFQQRAPFTGFLIGMVCQSLLFFFAAHFFWQKDPREAIKEMPHQVVYWREAPIAQQFGLDAHFEYQKGYHTHKAILSNIEELK